MDNSGLHTAQHFCLCVEGLKFTSVLYDPDFQVHWCLCWSFPKETSMRGLTPSLPILLHLLQHQQWLSLYLLVQKQEHLAKGGNAV